MPRVSVLLVCHANICRSPMAEGILRKLVEERGLQRQVKVDSAGTHATWLASRPDLRAQRASQKLGVDISRSKSRRIKRRDFARFDYILAMDDGNLRRLRELCSSDHRHKLSLLLAHTPEADMTDVPDPYYGSEAGFERVADLLYPALDHFLTTLQGNEALITR